MELSPEDQELLSELLLDWEEAYEKGREISPQTLCGNRMHLLEAVTTSIQALKLETWKCPPSPPECLQHDSSWQAINFFHISSVLKNRFRIDSILGYGGQGVVYKAFDLQLKRFVAIKTTKSLPELPSKDKQLLLDEAQKIASLNHSEIVPLYDIMEFHDSFLFVSEFLKGGDLGKALRENFLALNQKITILKMVALALHFAHKHGIIHRDIKPSNILLTQDLNPKISDFGIAFHYGENPSLEPIGSIPYASPEQIQGNPLDSSTDIWSMGVILFQACTKELPFQEPSVHETLQAILHSEPKFPNKPTAKIPGKLKELIRKCLAKQPNQRPESALVLANILSEIENELAPASSRRKYLLRIASLFAGFGFLAYLFQKLELKDYFLINPRLKENKPWQVTSGTIPFLNPRLNRLEHWKIGDPFSWEQVSPNSFLGKPGAHNIAFKHPLQPPLTLHFQLKVLSGIRVRVIFKNWDIYLGNEGFSRQISFFGDGKTLKLDHPYRYKLQEELKCRVSFNKNNYYFHVNNQLVSEGFVKSQTQPFILALSAGDPYSPGEVIYGNFLLEPN